MPLNLEIYRPERQEWVIEATMEPGKGFSTFVSHVSEPPIVYIAGCNKADTFAVIRKIHAAGQILPDAEYVEYPGNRAEKQRLEKGEHTEPVRVKFGIKGQGRLTRFKFF